MILPIQPGHFVRTSFSLFYILPKKFGKISASLFYMLTEKYFIRENLQTLDIERCIYFNLSTCFVNDPLVSDFKISHTCVVGANQSTLKLIQKYEAKVVANSFSYFSLKILASGFAFSRFNFWNV